MTAPEMKASPVFLTAREAQAKLRIGRNMIYDLARRREITYIRIGAKILFPEEEIKAFIRKNTVPAKKNFFGSHRYQDNRGATS